MYENDLPVIKERIYDENLIEKILEELECEYIRQIGNRWEAQLPYKFGSNNRRGVQVYELPSLPSKVRNKGISGDIFMLVGYILYEVTDFEELKEHLHQVKAWVCNVLGWDKYLEHRDDFEERVERKDYLKFLRGIQKSRKQRKRMQNMRSKENHILNKEQVFSWYRRYPHENFLLDGISIRTQIEFEVMFDDDTQRIVFPIYNADGELVSIKGRYVGKDEWIMDEIKYLYLYSFDKSIELFNLYKALPYIKQTGEVIVFESEKSCMKAWQYGCKNTVAISGSEISPIQAFMLKKLEANIIFAFDNDMEEEHSKKQSKQIKTRKCFYIKDKLGLLGEKDAPVDKGEISWKRLYKECLLVV
ncbi:toprim domain-containing protein [Brevibacillus laterosporus]|uniref:DNA primase n=1 Tax=Brevibacillus phage Sundance TaxID=1691958 RepID=UPI0006BDC13B|nr:DNA primase [Brevibacillus phage Sundance]ALA47949.1 putative DNA primase [Brevibacillus phage Sundance]